MAVPRVCVSVFPCERDHVSVFSEMLQSFRTAKEKYHG